MFFHDDPFLFGQRASFDKYHQGSLPFHIVKDGGYPDLVKVMPETKASARYMVRIPTLDEWVKDHTRRMPLLQDRCGSNHDSPAVARRLASGRGSKGRRFSCPPHREWTPDHKEVGAGGDRGAGCPRSFSDRRLRRRQAVFRGKQDRLRPILFRKAAASRGEQTRP